MGPNQQNVEVLKQNKRFAEPRSQLFPMKNVCIAGDMHVSIVVPCIVFGDIILSANVKGFCFLRMG